jgi:DNA-binding CsgD family transcriptional regulator
MMNARIAEAMGIGEAMVAKHLRSARRKLAARTREEAIAKAVAMGRLGLSR